KNAIGVAITAQITVTDAATPMLRNVTDRYTDSVRISLKFASVGCFTSWPVKSSTVQNDVTSSAASAPRYATTSQNSGADSSAVSRARGCRCSHEENRRAGPSVTTTRLTSVSIAVISP